MPTRRAEQAMAVFDEHVPRAGEPRLPRIEEQVVAVGARPIGHGHAGVGRRHQAADPDAAETSRRPSTTAQRWGQGESRFDCICSFDRFRNLRCRNLQFLNDRSASAALSVLRRRLRLRVVVGVDFRRAVFVRAAVDHRLEIEVAVARRARGLPFQRVGVPRIPARPAGRRRCCRRN